MRDVWDLCYLKEGGGRARSAQSTTDPCACDCVAERGDPAASDFGSDRSTAYQQDGSGARSERGAPERSEALTAGGITPPAGQRPKGAEGRGAGGRGQGNPYSPDPCNSTAGAARWQMGTTSLLSAAARGARPRRPSGANSERSRARRGGASATHQNAPCCCAWSGDEETRRSRHHDVDLD